MTAPAQPPAPLTEMNLVDEIKNAVNNAYTGGKPIIVAYVDESGQPSLSFRGSAQVYSDNQLAVWVRNPEGGLQNALKKNNHITMLFRDPETRAMLQFRGQGHIEGDDATRNKVYDSSPEPERNADKEKKGLALIVDLERVDGFMPGLRVAMRK
ncbi:MAG TPA: pyridoxamine 5'-phosphate oxidase family protein [Dehalococcoidia bacterium]|nr:pyridoxamine 5'-phosphate oxidase family protein [Dehalococcoidia bacterium]